MFVQSLNYKNVIINNYIILDFEQTGSKNSINKKH